MKNKMILSTTVTTTNTAALSFSKIIWTLLVLFCVIAMSACSTQLYAEPQTVAEPTIHKVYLSHHDFEFDDYTAAPGDIIEIINQSDISHSVFIETSDGEIINIDEILYVQTPGVSVKWQVPKAGEYTLRCWIHPIIRATLSVPGSDTGNN